MFPPFKQHRFANQLEPRCKLELLVFEHILQLLGCDVSRVLCLIWVCFDINIGFDEENVIDLMTKVVLATGRDLFRVVGITNFHVHPIFHHSVPCNEFSLGIGICPAAPG